MYAIGEGSEGCWKDYFLLRQQLIEQLIDEGIARTDGNGDMKQNELALNIAIFYCQQLFNRQGRQLSFSRSGADSEERTSDEFILLYGQVPRIV